MIQEIFKAQGLNMKPEDIYKLTEYLTPEVTDKLLSQTK